MYLALEDYAALPLELRLAALCLPQTKIAATVGYAAGRGRAGAAGDWDDVRLGPSPREVYNEGLEARRLKEGRKQPRFKPKEVMLRKIDAALKRLGPERLAGLDQGRLARLVLDSIKAEGDGFILEVLGIDDDLTIKWCPRKGRVRKIVFKTFKDDVAKRWRLSQK